MTDRRLNILVVDDDPNACLIMRAALCKSGFDVRVATSGDEGLRAFHAAPCDMVMLDVDMPGLGGHELCARLRAEAGPLLPIVMVTGMDDVASVETAYEHGATDFIAKPVNWGLIGHRVRYLFRGYRAMLDLRDSEARQGALLNAIPDLMFELDIDGRYIDLRAPRADLLLLPPAQLLGKTIAEVMPPEAARICMAALRDALENGHSSGQQFKLDLDQGLSWFELSVSRKAVKPAEKPRFIVLSRDITERKRSESRIARLAYYDGLTGLPNRQYFLERLEQEVQRAAQRQGKFAVLFMDLDGFKNVNDTLGHAAGDLLLQQAAARLREGVRPSDMLSRPMALEADAGTGDVRGGAARQGENVELARLGGDEFTALALDIVSLDSALTVAHRMGHLMRQPFVLAGRTVTVTASIGLAVYPHDGEDGATLLKHADIALYQAKSAGRDNATVYSAVRSDALRRRLETEASLRVALEREEFFLVYQPQIDAATGRIRSVEALIRWNHPTRGLVFPQEFIPLAEDIGLIERVGHWVLLTACTQAARWQDAGLGVTMAVNLSPLQLDNPSLPQWVMDVLAQTGLAPALLELEITESTPVKPTCTAREALQALRAQGVRIALDDFGTGYSSLSYLSRMPIGHIKVDKSFVACLLGGGESEAIVRAVLGMARSLGLRVTAEGVETLEQTLALQRMGCDSFQGFYFSPPLLAHHLPALIACADRPPCLPALFAKQWPVMEPGCSKPAASVVAPLFVASEMH